MTYLYIHLKIKPTTSLIINSNTREPVEIQEYMSLLKNIIIAMPDERPLPEDTQIAVRAIFGYTTLEQEPDPVLGVNTSITREPETYYTNTTSTYDDDDDDDELFRNNR